MQKKKKTCEKEGMFQDVQEGLIIALFLSRICQTCPLPLVLIFCVYHQTPEEDQPLLSSSCSTPIIVLLLL